MVDTDVDWQDRGHFFALAARTMRYILVDHARARASARRGGGLARITLEDGLIAAETADEELPALSDALERLAAFDERKARIIDLVYFAGLTQPEAAKALDISVATVERDLRAARAWLFSELSET